MKQDKRFWIGFDGFDLSKSWANPLHFATREEAEKYRVDHLQKLARYCDYCVEVYERES